MAGPEVVLVAVELSPSKLTLPIGRPSVVTLSVDDLIDGRHVTSDLQKKGPNGVLALHAGDPDARDTTRELVELHNDRMEKEFQVHRLPV